MESYVLAVRRAISPLSELPLSLSIFKCDTRLSWLSNLGQQSRKQSNLLQTGFATEGTEDAEKSRQKYETLFAHATAGTSQAWGFWGEVRSEACFICIQYVSASHLSALNRETE